MLIDTEKNVKRIPLGWFREDEDFLDLLKELLKVFVAVLSLFVSSCAAEDVCAGSNGTRFL
jgi:hypothetical protein